MRSHWVHPKVANCLQTRSLRLYKLNPPARVLRQSAQADIVCVAAISNRQVLLQKWDAPDRTPAFQQLPSAFDSGAYRTLWRELIKLRSQRLIYYNQALLNSFRNSSYALLIACILAIALAERLTSG